MLKQIKSVTDVSTLKDELPFDLDHCPTVGDVMSKDVLTLPPTTPLTDVAQHFAERQISSVVITDQDNVVGIFTQKDFLTILSQNHDKAFSCTLADRMATDINWILPTETVFAASQAMEEHHIRHLPVLQEGHLVGMVTQTDLIRALISFGSLQGVDEIMCCDIATVPVESNVQQAIEVMAKQHLSCVIVEEEGIPVGMITERDIVHKVMMPQSDPNHFQIRDLMSCPLKSIDSSFSIHSAGRLMDQKGIHRLVIVDNDKLQGIITQTDILKAVQCGLQAEHAALDAQAACKEVQSQLVQSEKLATIGQLAAGVAHELNTPVGFVNNNLETLQKYAKHLLDLIALYEQHCQANNKDQQETTTEILNQIQQQRKRIKFDFIKEDILELLTESAEGLDHVTAIVRNLRDFSRADKTDENIPYDINEGIHNTLIVAHNALKYDVELNLELGEIPEVLGQGSQINQVILNIVANAAQAITAQQREDKGVITIRTSTTEDHLVCEITDNGPGIAPENLDKIFDSFFTTKPPGKGTGLGLSVSYDIIVNKHQGELNVESEIDHGTTFTIKLPLERKERNTAESTDSKIFKQCPCCQETWPNRTAFIEDPNLKINGYQPDFESLEEGLFFFTHNIENCGSTMAVDVSDFVDLYQGLRYSVPREEVRDCPGYCRQKGRLDRCESQCECAFVREVMDILNKKEVTAISI